MREDVQAVDARESQRDLVLLTTYQPYKDRFELTFRPVITALEPKSNLEL